MGVLMSSLQLFMRAPRFLAPWKDVVDGKPAIYHCVSRVVDQQFLFKKEEREQFVHFMRLYARFCGVRILSYCVMSNHFHLLVEVPPGEGCAMDDTEFLRRLSVLYSDLKVLAAYRVILFEDGEEVFRLAENGEREVARKGIPAKAVKKVR